MFKSPFWINDVYGLGYWLKDYGYYPKIFPLFCYSDHGMTLFDKIPPHEIENDAPLIFKFSPRLVKEYKKVSDKPAYCILNPTIHCRTKKKLEKNADAKGTLFFPAHSTDEIDDETNWISFINSLEGIPENYKPIDICLHHWDMTKGLDKVFSDSGYKVLSAGTPYSDKFPENLYSILKNYQFTMSNLPGSYTFYSVEMGISFSLFGSEPKYNNRGDSNLESGTYTSYKSQPTYQAALQLFQGFHTQITVAQSMFVNFELGKYDTISRAKASLLLYKSLFQYLSSHPGYIKTSIGAVLRKFKNRFITRL